MIRKYSKGEIFAFQNFSGNIRLDHPFDQNTYVDLISMAKTEGSKNTRLTGSEIICILLTILVHLMENNFFKKKIFRKFGLI